MRVYHLFRLIDSPQQKLFVLEYPLAGQHLGRNLMLVFAVLELVQLPDGAAVEALQGAQVELLVDAVGGELVVGGRARLELHGGGAAAAAAQHGGEVLEEHFEHAPEAGEDNADDDHRKIDLRVG